MLTDFFKPANSSSKKRSISEAGLSTSQNQDKVLKRQKLASDQTQGPQDAASSEAQKDKSQD